MRAFNTLLFFSVLFLWSCDSKKEALDYPAPVGTIVKMDMEDGDKPDRGAWIESMHRTAPGVSWERMDDENREELGKYKRSLIEQNGSRDPGTIETIVDNHLSGVWYERGSKNVSGNVLATDYDPETDYVYTVSAGGNLWRGKSDGTEWMPINEELKMWGRMMHLLPSGRLVVANRGRPFYSDDNGETFTASAGINDNNGGNDGKDALKISKADGTTDLFYIARRGSGASIQVFHSSDNASTYNSVALFTNANINHIAIAHPEGTEDLYLIEQISANFSNIYQWSRDLNTFELINSASPLAFGGERGNLQAVLLDNGDIRFFAYNQNNELHSSDDFGATWNYLSTLPIRPWTVALYVSPSNPDVMYTGGVNAYRSIDGGSTWYLINEWWEYYDNVEGKLHADIMYYKEFKDSNNEPFLLISNHGGMSRSDDYCETTENIGLDGLNVSQFYSVATSPNDPTFVFAGSQDQGFQRGRLVGFPEVAEFDQVISGDYGHIIFTANGTKLWTVYPGGWMTYYDSPFTLWQGYTATYEVNSPDESVWIPPMMPHPDPNENIAYIAGGNVDSLDGRHIIEMKLVGGGIQATALPFDFSISGGNISAMEVNKFDSNIWYVATSNGRIYRSEDGGMSFTQTGYNTPGANYLYGSDILASKNDGNIVYMCGSGYSNPGVLKSTDGGLTWGTMSVGLPNTMIFAIAANDDESLLFAATELGPFVYVTAEDSWYPLSGTSAPFTRYWSVEWVPQLSIARFGTYGRGVWDFEVTGTSSNEEEEELLSDFRVYPNPATDWIKIDLGEGNLEESMRIAIYSLEGKLLKEKEVNVNSNQIDVADLIEGTYVIKLESKNNIRSKVFIKAK